MLLHEKMVRDEEISIFRKNVHNDLIALNTAHEFPLRKYNSYTPVLTVSLQLSQSTMNITSGIIKQPSCSSFSRGGRLRVTLPLLIKSGCPPFCLISKYLSRSSVSPIPKIVIRARAASLRCCIICATVRKNPAGCRVK